MLILNSEYYQINIQFRESFKHSAFTRSETETIITVVKSKDNIGYGEGCPRGYVTNETIKSSLLFLTKYQTQLHNILNIEEFLFWINKNRSILDINPAAFCSFELAFLDLYGRENKKSVEYIVGLNELYGNYSYTAVIGILTHDKFIVQVHRYLKIGFSDFKIKLSGNFALDFKNINYLIKTVSNLSIRLDANNLWNDWRNAVDYILKLDCNLLGVEEPLAHGDYEGMKKFSNATNTPVILDESFLRVEQFKYIMSSPKNWIINLRISKMGGVLRSIEIAKQAEILGIDLIIGAQVGETSILTRSALSIANHFRKIVISQEGAFGTFLLEKDITDNPIVFGKDGILESSLINCDKYGWGLDCINPTKM